MKSRQQTHLLNNTDYNYSSNDNIQEIDEYQQTVNTNSKYTGSRSGKRTDYNWCTMKTRNPIRRRLIKLIRSRWFERFIIMIIILNCIMLALYDPLDKKCQTKRCKVIEMLEYVVFPFFALEMILKMTALGIVGERSYFSDKWNIFDFLIIVMGIVDIAGLTQGGFLTIVRLGRILRPLRAINRVPSIRILVSLLMDTIPMLGNVLVLAFLVFSCFGIMGVQMFQGKLRNRCYHTKILNNSALNSSSLSPFYLPENTIDFVCHLEDNSCDGVPKKYPFKYCKNLNSSNALIDDLCVDENRFYRKCLQEGPNPFYGSVSFDNIAMAFVFIYQVVTLEGWGDLMYLLQDAYSFWTWIYFVTLIIVGSFFLVNLALVVITMQFSETKHREVRLMKKQRRLGSSQLSLYSDLRNFWYNLRHCVWFSRKRFQSVHHIHQHVHVHQEPFYCQQCKQSFSPEFNQSSLTAKRVNIPNIEISCFDDSTVSGNGERKRSASFPGSFPSSFNRSVEIINKDESVKLDPSRDSSMVIRKTSEQACMPFSSPITMKLDPNVSPSHSMNRKFQRENETSFINSNYLTPGFSGSRYGSSVTSSSNTISVHAQSISAVKIDGSRHNSINSHTALSLIINSSAGECIQTKTFVDTGISNIKNEPHITTVTGTECNMDTSSRGDSCISPSTEQSTEVCYDSMFDLRNCDKYYVSEEPTCFKQFRLSCKRFSESSKVIYFVMFIIVLNTVFMAMEHHQQPKLLTVVIEYCNIVFILIFFLEMVLKILGLGVKIYFKSGFNCFDFSIVVLSIAELMINNGGGQSFTIFRSLRLLRIFRLVVPMRHQIAVMCRTTSSVMTFFTLLFLFMFTFAILGMNLFGGKFEFKNRAGVTERSRSNFDSFVMAMVTVFQILTQEDWNRVMYDGIRATSKWATLYFLSLMTIGYYVLLNLLVAILVEGFTTPMQKERMAQRLLSLIRQNRKFTLNRTISLPDVRIGNGSVTKESNINDDAPNSPNSPSLSRGSIRRKTCGDILHDLPQSKMMKCSPKKPLQLIASPIECIQQKPKKNDPILLAARTTKFDGNQQTVTEWQSVKVESICHLDRKYRSTIWCSSPDFMKKRQHSSLYIFSKTNRFRKILIVVTQSKYFDGVMLILILYSCVLLGLETPTVRSKKLQNVIDTSTFALSWVFFVEMMMKVIASGFVIGKGSYLKNGWNVLDFLLVLTSMVDVIVTLHYSERDGNHAKHRELIKGLRVFRATRALRPLRMIRRAPGLKLVVQALLYSLKPIGNTVLIAAFFYIVFGILGVQLLRGTFYYCSGEEVDHVRNRMDCKNTTNAYWVNYQYNFDNVLEALMTLFIVSTRDGWVDIMHRGVDAVGIDQQPQPNYAPWRILYFVSFLLVGGFLVLNMIVGVVVENFQRCQELQEDQTKAKDILEKWKLCLRRNLNTYWHSYPAWRKRIYKMCKHPYWNYGITIVIFSNVIVMSLEHYRMSKTFATFLEVSNYFYTAIYVVEAMFLLTAFGFQRYFNDKWYVFDMVIVLVSILSIILETLTLELIVNPTAIKAMRLLRVVRAVKLLKAAKGLLFLLDHVAETIPQVTNLGLLFSLLFYVYSCLGMQLFGTLDCTVQSPCTGLGKHANFKSLGTSMLTLFRIATGDNWSGILKDTLRPNCDNSAQCQSNCCVASYVSPVFFVTFVLFAQFVLVNIVLAVLMKHLQMPGENKLKNSKYHMSDDTDTSSNGKKEVAQKRMENKERTFFAKWQGKMKRKMTPQAISVDKDKPYVRIKRSTDDLDNIQLKYYEAKSPYKVYEPYDPNFLLSPINKPSLLDRNAFKKNVIRKSSCPESMKFESRSKARRKSQYLNINCLHESDLNFMPITYFQNNDSRSSESGNDRNKAERVLVSQLSVPTPQSIRAEDIYSCTRWLSGASPQRYTSKERFSREGSFHCNTKISNPDESRVNRSGNEDGQRGGRSLSKNSDLCKIDIADTDENDLLLATFCDDLHGNNDGNISNSLMENKQRLKADGNSHLLCPIPSKENETRRVTQTPLVKKVRNEERAATNENWEVATQTCTESPDENIPLIVIHLADDSESDDSPRDDTSDDKSQNDDDDSTSDTSTYDDSNEGNSLIDDVNDDEGLNDYSTVDDSTNDERSYDSTSADTFSNSHSSNVFANNSVCKEERPPAVLRERKLGVCSPSSARNSSDSSVHCSAIKKYLPVSTSFETLNIAESKFSIDDSLNFSSCESIASLSVDDSGFMDNSSLGSYIIISANQSSDTIT